MELFIDCNTTPALANLTVVYRPLVKQLALVQSLAEGLKDAMSRRVGDDNKLHDARLRAVEVAAIRLSDAKSAMFPMINPVMVAAQAVQAEIPGMSDSEHYFTKKKAKNNVICAHELHELAATVFYTEEKSDVCAGIGLDRDYERTVNAANHRRFSVRFNEHQRFEPPYMNAAEAGAVNDWSSGQVSVTGEIRDELEDRVVSERFVREHYKRLLVLELVSRLSAHYWFGNLVSADWWNGAWLKEHEAVAESYGKIAELAFELKDGPITNEQLAQLEKKLRAKGCLDAHIEEFIAALKADYRRRPRQ